MINNEVFNKENILASAALACCVSPPMLSEVWYVETSIFVIGICLGAFSIILSHVQNTNTR
jgi:uncharacterized membrane protein YjjP (DUF1212 family)